MAMRTIAGRSVADTGVTSTTAAPIDAMGSTIMGDPHEGCRIQELSERMDDVHISDLQSYGQFFPPPPPGFNTSFDSQVNEIPPSQIVWSTEGVFNTGKRREMEHSSGPGPAKRARVTTLKPPAHLSQRTAEYPLSSRPSSFGGPTFAHLAQQPKLGGLGPNGSARIREWDHKQFDFEIPSGSIGNGNTYTSGSGGNDGRSFEPQWSFSFLG
ncbi:hypothetical protein PQX77_010233 [Marasmius sp. AFHP31]|nr:hypothetical protein PQX77_010233 [Marasmius sp. AFHP31]